MKKKIPFKTEKEIYVPLFRTIPANMIRVNRAKDKETNGYQRDAKEQKIKNIENNYNKYVVNPIKVVRHDDGYYYVWDGQHTLLSLMRIFGDDCKVPSLVYDEITPVQEAMLFEAQTGYSSKPTSVDIFNSKVSRNDEETKEIERICKAYGFGVSTNKNKPTDINCIDTLYNAYDSLGSIAFEKMIATIRNAWDGAEYSVDSVIIKALTQFYKEFYGRFDETRLKNILSKRKPVHYIASIKGYGSNDKYKYIKPILEEYNKKLHYVLVLDN